ncbi:MAG: hypothetical protein GY950_17270, partial [bacterium]|nr:hypothetical protein [bacterium]
NHHKLGYFNYETGSWQELGVFNGLIGDGVNSTFSDFEKNIWIACDRGVSKIASRRFSNFQMIHGLGEDEVTAVLEYKPGKFILGHPAGVTLYDGKRFRTLPFLRPGVARSELIRTLDMQLDGNGNIWVAASEAGMEKIDPRGKGSITWYGKAVGLPSAVICLWVDKKSHAGFETGTPPMWIGSDKIYTWKESEKKFVPQKIGKFLIVNSRRIYGSQGTGKLSYIAGHNNGIF